MAPFRAKIPWKRIRKGENKNYRFVPFLSGAELKMPKKKAKKLFGKGQEREKIKKNTIMASFQAKIGWKRMRNI